MRPIIKMMSEFGTPNALREFAATVAREALEHERAVGREVHPALWQAVEAALAHSKGEATDIELLHAQAPAYGVAMTTMLPEAFTGVLGCYNGRYLLDAQEAAKAWTNNPKAAHFRINGNGAEGAAAVVLEDFVFLIMPLRNTDDWGEPDTAPFKSPLAKPEAELDTEAEHRQEAAEAAHEARIEAQYETQAETL
jgi:hypothetical protein